MNEKQETIGEALYRVSGVSQEDMHIIFKQAKENHRKLNSCASHVFVMTSNPDILKRKFRCSNCQGEIDDIAHDWYQKGFQDGYNQGLRHGRQS